MKSPSQNDTANAIKTLLTPFENQIQTAENVFRTSGSITKSSYAIFNPISDETIY